MVWFEGAEIEATAFAIADNRTAEFAEWDQQGLAALLQELKAEDALAGVMWRHEACFVGWRKVHMPAKGKC